MTVLSRALIRRMIIQEMRLSAPNRRFRPKLSSGLSFDDDDDKTINIDDDTEIDDIPSFMGDDDDTESMFSDFDDAETEIDFDADMDDFGFDEFDDDDDDFEFESETEEDSESHTEYNQFGQMGMSGAEIRRHVMSQAEKLAPDMSAKNRRTRAEMQYDDLVRQGREAEMPDPEFQDTAELPPYELRKKKLREHINKRIQQSIRRRMLLL